MTTSEPNRIPDPILHTVDNQTPFRILQCDKMGPGRRFFDVVAIKGTFELQPGTMSLSSAVTPFCVSDETWTPEDVERSSLKVAGEILLAKPTSDVYFTGSVRAPGERPCTKWDVAVVVRNDTKTLVSHALTVTGPRVFQHSQVGGWELSDPAATERVPIRYELAYGGPRWLSASDPAARRRPAYRANPSGVGEFSGQPDKKVQYEAPQWHLPSEQVTQMNHPISPAGLGPIARHWSSRTRYAGTYDQAWRRAARTGPVDYPNDFNPLFFQCAPRGLVSPHYFAGDEWLGIYNGWDSKTSLVSRLPGVALLATLETASQQATVRLPLDTVHVDLDAGKVNLIWRLTLSQDRGVKRCFLGLASLGK